MKKFITGLREAIADIVCWTAIAWFIIFLVALFTLPLWLIILLVYR